MRKCDKERITDAIDEAFKNLHLTKVQLADRTGKTRHYYNNYLVGNLAPNEGVVKLLGDNLKIPYPVVRECLSYRRERYVKQHRKHAVVSKDVHNGINEGINHNDLIYDQYIQELCENINISDMKKLLYGSSLTPTEYMEICRALSGNGVATSSTYDNTHVIYIDEGLLKKAIIAAIKKVSQEIKETDKDKEG